MNAIRDASYTGGIVGLFALTTGLTDACGLIVGVDTAFLEDVIAVPIGSVIQLGKFELGLVA
jgi:hypothetical protein